MKYGYGRVSSKSQKLYGTSYQEQKDILVANGVPEENIYSDAYTGKKMSRDGFDKVLSLCYRPVTSWWCASWTDWLEPPPKVPFW